MADTQYGPLQPKQQSASDIRKVIANATKTTGKGYTIANNDELKEQKDKKEQKQVKVSTPSGTSTRTNTNVETPKVQTSTVKEVPQGPTPFPVIDKSQLTGDIFKNPQLQGIKNIPTFQEDNQAEHNVASRNNNDESFMNTFGRATELKKPVDVDNALMDLFVDVRGKVKSGTLAQSDVVKMKELYPEFANMGDDVILSMIGDMASMASKNMPFNNDNMAKFKSLYPELTAASWGFDKGSSENMYQAGGMREQMAQSSKTDLNRFGTAGALAEGVINPLGEVTTLADMGAQMIPQVDGSGNENRLKKALSKLTDEDINKYYEQYQNYVKNHGTLSNLYTLQLEGDTVVEQLWNWATGKGKKDVDAGFRDWLIDRVNNEVNGWAGEVTGAANDLKGVGGPNIAKMYANMPASTVKTITAITRAITNPIDTAAGLYHLFGTEEGRQALIARYGSWDGFAKALEQDPVGVASDGLAVVEGGAGLTKMAAGGLSKASLLAGLSTEALGAARTTENLLKLATRLENIAIKAGKIEKTAGLASNLGADLPINKVINGLRTWGESGESLIQKAAKYTANKATTGVGTIAGKVVDAGKDIVKKGPINSLADLLMGSATDSDKLFKAASPNINRLSNNVDYKNKRAKMDLAEQAIVDAGYLPKSISEWAKAHTETLNKKWNEFKQMVADKGDVMVDVRDILKDVKDYIKSEKDGATELQKQDLRKLEVEVGALERMGKVDMNFIEKRKEHYNSSWRDSDKLKVGDVYLKGIKMIGNAMRKQQDNILGKGPESTKKLRSEIAALMDTKNDVIKADIRNQKKKSDISGGGLVESYGRLSGLGDVIGGVVGGVLGKGGEGFAQAGKGIGKMVLGKAMGRAKDVDYLTKKGFEGLSNKKKAQNSAGLQSKFKDSKELGNMYVERDNLRKELKKDNISDSRKEAINKRLDDIEYAIAQKKARAGLGDKERVLSEENKKKVIDMVSKRAKDVGFTTEVLDGMEKDTQGYTDLRKKLIALEKNPGDTTAQHELFHAFFSVVDNKTKTYILDEAKKILKESGMKDVNAEEWLAESFGIYAKRKQIKLGLIDAPKGFVAKVRNFFQKVYEFMQRFNGDRATINKVFDEVLGDRQMKNGIIDLSDLLGDKEVKVRELGDNGLRNKSVYHGSQADFDKFDSSHMGEGEGNQAHGWGHYVAVNKGTAERYADMKNPTNYEYKGRGLKDIEKELWDSKPGEKVELIPIKQMLDSDWMSRYQKGERFDEIKKEGLERAKREMEYSRELYEESPEGISGRITNKERYEIDKRLYDTWKNLDKKDFDFEKPNRNLYTNDIPDPVKADTPTGTNYLEEKELMSADATKKFIEVFGKKHPTKVEQLKANIDSNGYGRGGRVEGWEMYTYLEDLLGSPKAASKFLESIGYDGIHYIGKIDGEAYVIFNDDSLEIKDHIRYKKKIGDKEVEINKDITSPEQMAKVNSKGLSVIHDFISEKQAEKALDVNKALLDKDGNAYLWTHTNKYGDNPITNFENVKDSKYKGYEGKEIAWFTNNADMSKSYAGQKSKLANTKAPRTEEEFNKWLKDKTKELQKEYGGQVFGKDEKLSFTVKEGKNGYYIEREIKNNNEVMDKDKFRSWVAMWQGLTMSDLEKKEKNLGGLEGLMKSQEDRLKNNGYANVDFKIDGDNVILNYSEIYKATPEFKDKKEFYAKAFSSFQGRNYYHYQGIIQDMKKPLVVDFGEERYWNDLGKVSDMLTENQHKSLVASSHGRQFYTQKVLDFIHEITAVADEYEAKQGGKYYSPTLKDTFFRILRDDIRFLNTDGIKELINNYDTIIDDALEFDRSKGNFDGLQTFRDVAEHSIELIEENRPQLEKALFKNVAEELKAVGGEWLVNHYKEQFGLNANELLLNQEHFRDALHDTLETNDWVKYALSKGEYDGVIFKNVRDYGGAADKNTPGDVVAAFNSKQFKAWDNSNPTDSKYISYKKKVSLDKKSEGLQKKNSSGLLAKGRERMGDNGIRYKKDIPEDKKLIGLHNLSVDKLRKTVELGGMPMPSIAVTKKGIPHTDYGDVTFIMKESAINPKLNRNNKLYTVDGYTPMAQQPIVKMKDTKDAWAIEDKIEKETGLSYSEIEQWIENKEQMEYYHPELKKFDKEYNQMTEKKLWGGFTPSGKRRYLDYNLDNVVKKMKENKEDAFNGMYWKMVAQYEGETKTVDSLRERNYGLKNKEVGEELFNRYYSEVGDLYAKLGGGDSFREMGYFQDTLSYEYDRNTDRWLEKVKKDQPKDSVYTRLQKSDLEKLQKTIKEGAELQRPYSEAKPERGIRFDEVGAVVAPEGKLKEVKDILKDTGLKVYGYKEGERMSVVDKVADDNGLRFKKKVDQTDTPEFKKWFEGSKVVDKEGKPLEVYHGSRHAGFTEFKPVNSFEDGLYFFSNKRHIASYFGGGDTLWSDKGLQGKFDEAKAKGIDEVKKFAKRYFNTPQEIEVSMNHITPKEAKEFGVDPGYFYHIDDGQVASPIRINGKRTFDKPLSQKEIDDAILREVQLSVDFYGAEDKKKSQVYASYLDIKNPLEIEAKGNKFSHVLNPIDGQYHHVADIAYMAKENGYDGVIIKDVSESPEKDLRGDDYIVWDSRQIKSATDNIGTFDKNNPDIRYKKGYHGSKADFDRFDSSHMGEGEGNQAHGYGHYIAATKKTAKGYAQMGGNPRLSFKGLNRDELADRLIDAKLDGKEFPDGIANAIITRIEDDGLTFKEAKKEAINTFNNIAEEYKANGEMDKFNQTKEEIKTLEGLQRKEFEMKKGRNLYTVEIPDSKKANTPSGENYLNEEKVYGKKVYEKIFEEARKNKGWVNNKGAERYINDRLNFRGKDQMYGVWINKALEAGFGNDQKAVAKFLEGLGYDGIEYKGLQDGKAYVVFKDDDIDITNHIRYKKNSEGKDLSEGQIKYFADSKARNDKGELLVVYRGTKNIEGDRFLYSKDHQTGEDFGKAYYFTTNKRQAQGYAFDTEKTSRWQEYMKKREGLKKKYMESLKEEDKKAFLSEKYSDVMNEIHDNMDKYPEAMGEVSSYYLNITQPLEYDAQGKNWNVYEKLFKEVKRSKREDFNPYDGIIVHNVKDNSVLKNGETELMDVYITFNQNQAKYTDNLNPTTKLSKRLKKNVGLQKKENGLDKKSNASILAKGRDRK